LQTIRSLPALARRRPIVAGLLLAITILGAVLRFDAIGTSTRVSVDERSYLGIANNMVVHHSYAYGSDPLHWAPGTPFMFTAVMKLTGTGAIDNRVTGASNPPLYAQAVVGTLTILAVFALAAWLGGAIPGLIAAFFVSIYDPLVLVARSYLSEPLGGFFFVLAVLAICVAVATPERRKRLALGAGFLLGCAVLSRNDLLLLFGVLPGLAFLMAWKRESLKAAFRLGALLVVGAVVTVAPWVTYASIEQHRLTPITTAGPSSLWVATYLPAGGRQILLKRQFAAEVCRTFPTHQDACGVSATQMDMRLIFAILQKRHPGLSQDAAIQKELDKNIRDYAFGQPLKFANMLLNKSGRIWLKPWGGGAIGRQESSIWQHRILLGLSLIGMLAGLAFAGRRRKYVLLGFAALFAVTALNTIFVSESRMSMRMDPLLFATGIGAFGAIFRARTGDDEPELPPRDAAGDGPDGAAPVADGSSESDASDPEPANPGTPGPNEESAPEAGVPSETGASPAPESGLQEDATESEHDPVQGTAAGDDTQAVNPTHESSAAPDAKPQTEGQA
jgi:hypothetical protein